MEYSIAAYELKSIAKGVEAADAALKSANVKLVSAQPVCPGKFEIFLAGPLSDVKAASDRIDREFGEFLIDSVQIGRIDQSVAKALLGALPQPTLDALGSIETFTAASTIMAADAAVKSACVSILELRIARGMGGKGYVSFTGAAADTPAAIEAGSASAKRQGTFVASSFIAAPHRELWNLL
ncbi:MAG: BMC domain-containing protein [Clostridiales bacterium]|nr:BMC domain-containing protein [Clostridiales bacterium]